jgi:hypothetical protein
MFARESEMTASVARWMKASGMVAKPEFVTPWGICDFVGVRLNPKKVACRLEHKQVRSVSSITRAVLLLQIPDFKTGDSITLEKLARNCEPSIPEETVRRETSRLIGDRFVVCSSRKRLQKVNGWIPLQDRIVAVELKLSRIDEAMHQAANNLGFAEESYVALPADVARRVVSSASRCSKFSDAGVGLLSVARHRCEVLLSAPKTKNWMDTAIQLYCVEKFWTTRPKDS